MMQAPISYNNQYLYPNPSSIGPNRPVYQDNLDGVQNSQGSFLKYGLTQFGGSGSTTFNVGSYLPVNQAVYDVGFAYGGSTDSYPIQFNGRQDYNRVTDFLLHKPISIPQTIPYNFFVRDQGELYQIGSQIFNLMQPIRIQENPMPYFMPQIGINAMPMAFGYGQMPNPYAFAQASAGGGYPVATTMNPYANQALAQGLGSW